MGLRSWLSETLAAVNPTASVVARVIPTWKAATPLGRPDDYAKFLDEGYRQNLIVAACIWEIVTSASEPELKVYRVRKDGTEEEVADPNHPLNRLITSPNPEHSRYQLLEVLLTAQQATGNWFLRKIRSSAGIVVALWPIPAHEIKIKVGASGWVDSYVWTPAGGTPIPIPAEDIVHDPLHHDPLNELWGLSPIAVLARHVDLDNMATDYLRAFFKNDGTPAGLLKFKTKVDPSERRRVKELWGAEHSGGAGWHTVSVLDADVSYEALGASPEKLRLNSVWEQTETRICSAFGVPPILIGTLVGLNRSTFSNYKEARTSFWQETLAPLYQRFAERWTKGIAAEFGPEYVIRFDLSKIAALQEDRDSKRRWAREGWDSGLLTYDEARIAAGEPPVGGEQGARLKEVAEAPESPLAALVNGRGTQGRRHPHDAHGALTTAQKKAQARFKKVAKAHFAALGSALGAHLQ